MLTFVILGLASGALFGLPGVGLVLEHKTSGVFNFAHGALATVTFSGTPDQLDEDEVLAGYFGTDLAGAPTA